jgi:hypothetical protein
MSAALNHQLKAAESVNTGSSARRHRAAAEPGRQAPGSFAAPIHSSRRSFVFGLTGGLALAVLAPLRRALAQAATPGASSAPADTSAILIKNARIFDGLGDRLWPGHLLIQGRTISQISKDAIAVPPGCRVIDGGGRVLMPGLTDAHWHMTMIANTLADLEQADTGLMYANTVAEARRTLLRGFTTVRDMAGPSFGIKQAIDTGVIPGPRVYPSGALISATGGHGDFSAAYGLQQILGGQLSHLEAIGKFAVVNGVPQVLAATREQLKRSASQIKIAVGGGVISGGQTGADRTALDWAINNGIPHGGWCPKGRRAEDGLLGAVGKGFCSRDVLLPSALVGARPC